MNKLKEEGKKYDKIPKWNFKNFYNRNCPFCNSKGEFLTNRPDNLKINYCNLCGCFFISPAPQENELNDFYNNYSSKYHTVSLNKYLANHLSSMHPFCDIRVREINSNIMPEGKKVLDVGCGYGASLILFQELGAEVKGIDLDHEFLEFIKNNLDIKNVENCDIEDIDGNYDIILMNDFIEHPLDPLSKLFKAKELLNKNGILAIWTPNASFVFEESDPLIFKLDYEHLQYLTFKTCVYLSEILELDLLHLESLGFQTFSGFNTMNFSKIHDIKTKGIKIVTYNKILYNFLQFLNPDPQEKMRDGKYHLFCIFKKQ